MNPPTIAVRVTAIALPLRVDVFKDGFEWGLVLRGGVAQTSLWMSGLQSNKRRLGTRSPGFALLFRRHPDAQSSVWATPRIRNDGPGVEGADPHRDPRRPHRTAGYDGGQDRPDRRGRGAVEHSEAGMILALSHFVMGRLTLPFASWVFKPACLFALRHRGESMEHNGGKGRKAEAWLRATL